MNCSKYKKYLIQVILIAVTLLLGIVKLPIAQCLYFEFAEINNWFILLLQTIIFSIIGFCYYTLGFFYNETLNNRMRLSINGLKIIHSIALISLLTFLSQLIYFQLVSLNMYSYAIFDIEIANIINIGVGYSVDIFIEIIFIIVISNMIKKATDSQWRIYNLEFMKDFKSLAIILIVSISGGILNYYMNVLVFSLSWEINRMQSLFEGLTIGSIYIYSIYRNHKGIREKA